jgi:hypothetical protein
VADTFKLMAQGQLASSAGTIYTASGACIVKYISLVNATATNGEAWKLYAKSGSAGTAATNLIGSGTLDAFQDTEWSGTLSLANGDVISGVTTDATTVTYTISGDENVS